MSEDSAAHPQLPPFHLAFPVRDVQEARVFYTKVLGCSEGRSSARWQDFSLFGHQAGAPAAAAAAAAAADAACNQVDGDPVPVPHFGAALSVQQFQQLAERVRAAGVSFVIEPHTRFKGQPGEQHTMFFKDPSGNSLEFKAMTNPANLMARPSSGYECGDGHRLTYPPALQVVVWGATGFTGRLVCEHLVRDYQSKGIRWAMAGRNRARLEEVKQQLTQINPACASLPCVIADADDEASLAKLAADTNVIIATAGPFAKYGSKVVAAAVQQGTHYCDITGELVWVKRMIAAHHEAAAAKGVKVVHCCGYDSTPFDLGVLLLADHARKQLGRALSQAYGLCIDARGGFSGGTIASGFNQAESEEPARASRRLTSFMVLQRRACVPAWPGCMRGSDKPPGLLPEWNEYAKRWMGPFVMEAINSRIVQRSSLLNGLYGPDFKYREAMATGGLLGAAAMSGMMAGIGAMFALGPLRSLAKKRLPQPGEGPTRDAMMNGYWEHSMIGLTQEQPGQEPQVIVAECGGLCLALDGAGCSAAGCQAGGVLTPASAMGMVLVQRLRDAGIRFEVTQSPALGKQQQQVGAAAAGAGKQ
ncbi:hypothetical protein COO60DRAFT_1638196 [Scenedesmus sp. NREL 46B-D3]|nr:hypothetical protein COO60DRAFT_1638196 [Scenedesmus sp. NREL 46B-D3]